MGLALYQFLLMTTITAHTTSVVPDEMKGSLLGMEHSLFAVVRVFGPAMGIAARDVYFGWGGRGRGVVV